MFRRKHPSRSFTADSQAAAEAKIIVQARKHLRHIERWGRWYTAFYLVSGFAGAGAVIVIGLLIENVLMGMVQGGQRLEFVLGFALGSLATAALYQISHLILQAYRCALPDHSGRLLVEYHDALTQLMARSAVPQTSQADHPEHVSAG